jgi:phosphatidylinositol glycan class T
VVTDPTRLQKSHDGWSLSALFEKKIRKSCPLAHHSSVIVKKSQAPFDQEFVLDEAADEIADNGDNIYDLSKRSDFDLSLKWKEGDASFAPKVPQSFYFERYFTGHGQERGGLLVELSNPTSKPLDIVLFQVIPWYLKFYMHTLTVECKDQETNVWNKCDGIITKTYYQSAIPRTRPTIIEQLLILPSKTTTRLHVDFDKAFIKYTEHPPDSNRGFDVSAAIVTHGDKRYFSRNLLIHLATPDFSMPYNVITLSCTVLALLAGGMFNLLIRDFKPIVFEKAK